MLGCASRAAEFPLSAEIQVASNGQLVHVRDSSAADDGSYGNKIRGAVLATEMLDEEPRASSGISFALSSCDRCFESVLVGMTSRHDLCDSMEYGVQVDQDRYYEKTLSIRDRMPTCRSGHLLLQTENPPGRQHRTCNGGSRCNRHSIPFSNAERIYRCDACNYSLCWTCYGGKLKDEIVTYTRECDGDEYVSIRIDSVGARVEYLVNDEVVYRSEKPPRFSLACKVVHIVRRNQHHYSGPWKMHLPVKKLHLIGTVIVTLRLVSVGYDDTIVTAFHNMAGEELARAESTVGDTVGDLKDILRRQRCQEVSQMCFISQDGKRLSDDEPWPLRQPWDGQVCWLVKDLGQGCHGLVTSCSNLAGEELARVESVVGENIADLKRRLRCRLGGTSSQMCMVSAEGVYLADSDFWPAHQIS